MAKKQPEKSERQLVVDAINKQYGEGTLMNLTGVPAMHDFPFQISTGSISLDLLIAPVRRLPDGRWQTGICPGRMYEIFGPEQSGKTTTMASIVANAQAMGKKAAFIDMEHAVDAQYFRKLGVRLEDLFLSQPSSGEKAMEIADKLIKSRQFDLVVVDSVATLVTDAELAGEISDDTMGALARLLAKSFKHLRGSFGGDDGPILLMTNQIRFKVGKAAQYGNPETTPGGTAMRHAMDMRIDVRKGALVTQGTEDGPVIGQRMRVKVIKNKLAPPFQACEVSLLYGIGVDRADEMVDLCTRYGVIPVAGAWYDVPGYGKVQGKMAVIQAMREVVGLPYTLYDALLTQVNALRGFTPEGLRIPGWTVPERGQSATEMFAPQQEAPASE